MDIRANHAGHEPCPDPLRAHEQAVTLPEQFDAGIWFIGRISTPWKNRSDCPRRGDPENGPLCHLTIAEPWVAALREVEKYDHLHVLYWMTLSRRDTVLQNPYFANEAVGTFSIRSPLRPNPVALSQVRLIGVEGPVVTVRGLDCVDGTPLVDLKPEFPATTCA